MFSRLRTTAAAALSCALLLAGAGEVRAGVGADLIKRLEGYRSTAYQDGGGVWTICWGLTGQVAHPGVRYSQAQCEALFRHRLAQHREAVRDAAGEMTPEQEAALLSFSWNVGIAAMRRSTLIRHHRAGECWAAAGQFERWVYADGQRLAGLERRRRIERDLYMKGCKP